MYSASKAFVASFSETLWHEQKSRGAQVMALCPVVTITASQTAADVPSWLVQSPQQVVARALRALTASPTNWARIARFRLNSKSPKGLRHDHRH